SITSKCTQSAPAARTLSTSSPSLAKLAERMDGAITGACIDVIPNEWEICCLPRAFPGPDGELPPPLRPDPVVGGVDLARLLLGLLAQLRRGAGHLAGVVLRHQAAIGLVDFSVAGFAGHAQCAIRRAAPTARGDPAR